MIYRSTTSRPFTYTASCAPGSACSSTTTAVNSSRTCSKPSAIVPCTFVFLNGFPSSYMVISSSEIYIIAFLVLFFPSHLLALPLIKRREEIWPENRQGSPTPPSPHSHREVFSLF